VRVCVMFFFFFFFLLSNLRARRMRPIRTEWLRAACDRILLRVSCT
jgi:hypothetical protein